LSNGKRIWFCLVAEVEYMNRLLPQAVPYLSPLRGPILLLALILGIAPQVAQVAFLTPGSFPVEKQST